MSERERLADRLYDIARRHLDDVSGWNGVEPELLDLLADAWDDGYRNGYSIGGWDSPTARTNYENPYREDST